MESAPTLYPLEINGEKYLICKLPDQPFSTLHDPDTKHMVGQWNNDTAQYVLYPLGNLRVLTPAAAHLNKTLEEPQQEQQQQEQQQQEQQQQEEQQFEEHMRQLIASGAAFTIAD
jgi:hypothetical protein